MAGINGISLEALTHQLCEGGLGYADAVDEAQKMLAKQGAKVGAGIKPGKLLRQAVDDSLNIGGKPAFSAADIQHSAFRAPGVVKKGGVLGKKAKIHAHKNAKAVEEGAKAYTKREAARVAADTARTEALKPQVSKLKEWYKNIKTSVAEGGSGIWNAIKKHPVAAGITAAVVIAGGVMIAKHNSNKDVKDAA